jgi:oligopeptide/dipeptide ABC transporter ATP-binding protein
MLESMAKMNNNNLVELKNVKKYFPIGKGFLGTKLMTLKAVDGVSLAIKRGETLGLVGESGCGKSTLGRLILGLDQPTSGDIYFKGENILYYDSKQMKRLRRDMQVIFQDPFSSLNPRRKIFRIVGDPLVIHGITLNRRERESKIAGLIEKVGLKAEDLNLYPHQFSGGQRQRIGIARALALNPELIIADEPISSLDVSIQAQIINLLLDLQEEFNLTYLFISHDLKVVGHVSDRVAVMYLGRIVEFADAEELYNNPVHPYSEALLSSSPIPDPSLTRERIMLEGDIPSPINPPFGCHFRTRCPLHVPICSREVPRLRKRPNGSLAACHVR